MKIIDTSISDVKIIEPKVFKDSRGYFYESFSQKEFNQLITPITFVQDNQAKSSFGVLRGLHFQKPPYSQSKLVRVISGKVLDVAVDIRKESPTYGQYESVVLSGDNMRQLFIPKGFAHGYSVLSDEAVFQYKCDEYYHPESEGGIIWNDPDLKIDWMLKPENILLSDKDTNRIKLSQLENIF
ncbi:MAG: dTDP-4-dehydrorhamnose 3,5-epimerase [Bacteroidales bacterium]